MAHSRIENTRVIHLILNEEEAVFLRNLTQNSLLRGGDAEPLEEGVIMCSIWEELNITL